MSSFLHSLLYNRNIRSTRSLLGALGIISALEQDAGVETSHTKQQHQTRLSSYLKKKKKPLQSIELRDLEAEITQLLPLTLSRWYSLIARALEASEKFCMQTYSYVWLLLFNQNAKRDARQFFPTRCLLKFINCPGYHCIGTHCFPCLSVMEFFHVNVPHFL